MLTMYRELLMALAIIHMLVAARIVSQSGRHAASSGLVALGLLIGQWWLVEALLVQALWSLGGFAP